MKFSFSWDPFGEHRLVVTVLARRRCRKFHIQVATVAIQVGMVLVENHPCDGMIKGADFPVDMTAGASGRWVPEGFRIAVADRTSDVGVIGIQIPPG